MRKCLLSISLCLLCLVAYPLHAQSLFPDSVGERLKYDATIEMKNGYLSGICILLHTEDGVKGCLFNEFGISALDFTYYPERNKVQLDGVLKMLDKWYIKKVLRKDILLLMKNLQQGVGTYRDEKFKIDYKFSLLKDATEE